MSTAKMHSGVFLQDTMEHFKKGHAMSDIENDWNFDGTPKDLVEKYYNLSAYNHQFLLLFGKNDKFLSFIVMMNGFQDEAQHFKVSISFFNYLNGKVYSVHDCVHSITKEDYKDYISLTPLKKITEYYDPKTDEFKEQEKIHFTLKISNEKLDEIAKDEKVESGVEDN